MKIMIDKKKDLADDYIIFTKKLWQINSFTAQKMNFSIIDFFSKCNQIPSFLWIWLYLLKTSLMESFNFCAVKDCPQLFGDIIHS